MKVYIYACTNNGNVQQDPIYIESCVTKEVSISPRFSPPMFDPDANSILLRAHLCAAVDSMRRKPCIMQEGVFTTPQEAMEPILNETLICDESKPSLKALKSSLAFHNRERKSTNTFETPTTRPNTTDAYNMLLAQCTFPTGRYEVTFPMSYRNVGSSCPHYRERRRSLPPHRPRRALRSGRW